jgi:flavin reductase (DIM6/NTAB) family NADH-FMN oxidoreductase RutF
MDNTEKTVWKGSALTGPVPPALVVCGTAERPNVLTVAWTGIVNSHPPMTYVSVRPERYSYALIDGTGEFTVNLPTSSMARETDICGTLTGAKTDKIKKCGFTLSPGTRTGVPVIAECPLSLECRVSQKLDLGSHTMFIAEILAVQVASRLIDSKGKLNLQQAGLLAFSHGEYFALGRKCGNIGFSTK